jgi:hypothetical protein
MTVRELDEPEPRLVRVTAQLLVLLPIRLALALAGLGGSMVVGEPAPAALAFSLGALGAAIALGADPRYSRDLLGDVPPLPPNPRFASLREMAAAGVVPSTVGVALLTAIALFFDGTLAAVLAGVLAGMAVAGFASWVNLAAIERGLGCRLYLERRPGSRVFAGPR